MIAISMLVFVVTGPTPDLFIDDFETGDLSKWDTVVPAPPTLMTTGGGEHRSGFSAGKFIDPEAVAGSGIAANAFKGFSGQANLHARFWMKVMSTGDSGVVLPVTLKDSARNQALAELQVSPDGTLWVGGYSNNSYIATPLSNSRVDGGWQLVELAALNVGSGPNGSRSVWLDGQLIGSNAMNYNAKIADQTVLGGTWENDRQWTGEIWFDDVRLRPVPNVSTLKTRSGAGNAGECFAVTVDLLDSSGGGGEEAFEIPITWSLNGPAVGPYGDSSCSAPPAAAIPLGTFNHTQWVLLTAAGTVTVGAKSIDFIDVPGTLSVSSDGGFVYDAGTDAGTSAGTDAGTDAGVDAGTTPDAGFTETEPTLRQDRVECGCSAAGSPLALLLLISGLRARATARRRDRRTS